MPRLVECVPNFSEGRRREVVDEIMNAIAAVPGVTLLDRGDGPGPQPLRADVRGRARAGDGGGVPRGRSAPSKLIDLNQHQRPAPAHGRRRRGAVRAGGGLSRWTTAPRLARRVGKRIGDELAIPVFLYEAAASERRRARAWPTCGAASSRACARRSARTPRAGPTSGPSASTRPPAQPRSARDGSWSPSTPTSNTGDVRVAKAVAAAIREQSGGLKNVRALGFSIENGRRAQVSMNLVNVEATPIHRVLALVRDEAARHGAAHLGLRGGGAGAGGRAARGGRAHAAARGLPPRPGAGAAAAAAAAHRGRARSPRSSTRWPARRPRPAAARWRRSWARSRPACATMVANLTLGKKKYAGERGAP